MEFVLTVLGSYVAVGLSLVVLLITAAFTYQRLRAERKYMRLLRKDQVVVRIRRQREVYLHDGELDDVELAKLIAELESVAKQLSRRERTHIIGALRQPSPRGRERYVDKLLQA